jgi:hypothetical protein
MSSRAIFLAFVAAAIICGVTYFNDSVLYQTMLVGNHMPMSVFGALLPLVLLVNPLLRRCFPQNSCSWLRPFSAKELFVLLALILPMCSIPYSSMMRLLPRALMLPHHYAKTDSSWKLPGNDDNAFVPATTLLPKRALADPDYDNGNALLGFVQGSQTSSGAAHIHFRDVPWPAWRDALGLWLPMFMLLWLALSGLALVFHKQWAENEHLPYPVVQFAKSLMPEADGSVNAMFRNKLFWIAFGLVFAIHLNNYLYVYNSEYLIEFKRTISFAPLSRLFPTFMRGGGWSLVYLRLYFTVVAIAFLIPSDVSLSIGVGPFVFTYIAGVLAQYGLPVSAGAELSPRIYHGMVLGGFIGLFCVMFYTGRHYYLGALKQALCLGRRDEEISSGSVWGLRLFLLAFAVMVGNLVLLGLDWQLALLYTGILIILFVVLGRIIAETGAFHLSPGIYPCVLIVAFMGEQALGLTALGILFFLTTVFILDPRESFMPFMINALALSTEGGVKHGRLLPVVGAVMLFGLCIAVPVTLYFSYDRGVNWRDGFASSSVPRFAVSGVLAARTRMLAQDTLTRANEVRGFERLALAKPSQRFVVAFAMTFAGVLLFTACRLRFARWPLHPVLFCLWPRYAGYMLAASFLLGGLLKIAVTRYGGAKSVQRLRPFMFGMIAADMLAGLVIIISGFIYYWLTGTPPKNYWVLPG